VGALRALSRWICIVAALGLAVGSALAQATTASLSGTVRARNGSAVTGGVVQARSEESGTTRTAAVDGSGRYRFESLPTGTWTVVARSADGVLTDTRTVTLGLQQAGRIDLVLGAGLEEEMTVTAEAPLVDTQRTGGELRITGEQADRLPIAGRDVTQLALLDASVRQAAPASYYGERAAPFVINGQTGRSNSYLVDGLDNNDTASGTSLNASFSPLVIREFVLMTHQFAPEFGRASGGVMNILTQRGTNDPDLLGFVQGSPAALNESGGLVDSLPDTAGVDDTSSALAAGFRWGGPLQKDRAFLFAAFEHQQGTGIVPYSGTTRDGIEGGRFAADNRDDNAFVRFDVNLGAADSLLVRLSYDDRATDGLNVGGIATPEWGFHLDESDVQVAAALTSVISPSLIHELRILYGRSRLEQRASSSLSGVERPSTQFGGNNLNRQSRDERAFELLGNLTAAVGRHTMKFGYDVKPSRTTIGARFNPNGNFIYRTDARFEPGDCGDIVISDLPKRCSEDASQVCFLEDDQCPAMGKGICKPYYDIPIPCPGAPGVDDDGDGLVDEPALPNTYPLVFQLIDGQPEATLRDTQIAAFAQDAWQATPRLLLDFGLRYDLSTFTLPSSAAVASIVRNGGAGRDTNNLAPRLGFTYAIGEDRGLVIRGGAGVFYNKSVLAFPAVASITSGTSIGLVFPQGFTFELTEDTVEQLGIDVIKPIFGAYPQLVLRFSTGTELDATQANVFNLGFEKSVGKANVVGANATRARTYHVPLMKDLNPVVGTDLQGVPIHLYDDQVGSIAAVVTEGESWYSELDLAWRWRGARAWSSVSYTLSKAEDMGPDPLKGGIYLPPDSLDLSTERGPSDNDRRHRVVLAGDIPLGPGAFRLAGVYQYGSPLPFNVTTGSDDNSDGITSDRPPGVGRNTGGGTPLDAVNLYRANAGLGPVGSLSSPYLSQLDARVYWQFGSEPKRVKGEAFLQVFNLLGRDNGGLVEGRALASNFGRVIGLAGPPRSVELGFKVGF